MNRKGALFDESHRSPLFDESNRSLRFDDRAGGAGFVSPALQRGEHGSPEHRKSRRDGAFCFSPAEKHSNVGFNVLSDSTSYSFNPYRRFTLSSISGVVSRARISAFRRLSSWMISGVLMLAALRLLAALSAPWRAF